MEELTSGFKISIHALREEGDPWGSNPLPRTMTNVLTAFSCQRTFVIFLFAK